MIEPGQKPVYFDVDALRASGDQQLAELAARMLSRARTDNQRASVAAQTEALALVTEAAVIDAGWRNRGFDERLRMRAMASAIGSLVTTLVDSAEDPEAAITMINEAINECLARALDGRDDTGATCTYLGVEGGSA